MLPARRPYPDELAFSALLRCCRQFQVSFKCLGQIHLGRVGWRPSQLGAPPLGPLAELFGLSKDDLLWKHTVFPYATAMMHRGYYGGALDCATRDANSQPGLGAVTQNVSLGVKKWRFCALCAREEVSATRESWWHRSHNLPGVIVCLSHNAFLIESAVPVNSTGPLLHDLPHECRGRRLGTGVPRETLLKVSQTSVAWLSRERGPGAPPTPSNYRELAINSGWLDSRRDVEASSLARALTKRFSKPYLERCGVPTKANTGFWAALMLRSMTDLPYAPVKHALLQTLLSEPPPPGCSISFAPKGPSGSSARQVDEFYSRGAKAELKRLLRTGEQLTTEAFLRGVGCWGAYKHRGVQLPDLRAVVREFRGSEATVKRLRPGKTLYRSERSPAGGRSAVERAPARSTTAHGLGSEP